MLSNPRPKEKLSAQKVESLSVGKRMAKSVLERIMCFESSLPLQLRNYAGVQTKAPAEIKIQLFAVFDI